MPPLVPDSDDEEVEDLSAQPTNEHERWMPSAGSSDTAALAPITTAGSYKDPSTRSTERLQRQIHETEMSLFENLNIVGSLDGVAERDIMTTEAVLSGSPTRQLKKRRNTDEVTSGSVTGKLPLIKRASTAKVHALAGNEESLDPMQDENTFAYPLPHISDQSNASLDFMNHEPVIMFRDSGSTVPDNESQQERILEEFLRKKQVALTAGGPVLTSEEAGEDMKSSSFPWTASMQTQSTRLGKTQDEQTNLSRTDGVIEVNDADLFAPKSSQIGPSQTLLDIDSLAQSVLKHSTQDFVAEVLDPARFKRQSSPFVQIPAKAVRTPSKEISTSNSTARKREVKDELVMILSPDEAAIGLPEEQYKPRPSKRRAASMVEEPVDLSIVPGKKKRVKRTKTGPAAMAGGITDVDCTVAQQPEVEHATKEQSQRIDMEGVHAANIDKQHDNDVIEVNRKYNDETPKKPSLSASVRAKNDNAAFAVPQEKPKSASRIKRSQTTIFEDHIEFSGSKRALNLSQQQEKRKCALPDVKNTSRHAVKRRKVIDDDNDEDELAGEETIHKRGTNDSSEDMAKQPAMRRSRGRPKRTIPEAKIKSKEFVLEEPEKEATEKESESANVSTKNNLSCPANAKATILPEPAKEDEPQARENISLHPDPFTLATPAKPTTQDRTPLPEKATPTPENITLKVDKKPTSATHSPIKSGLVVPYRVGLSKRQRIPSLLRTMKPPVKR